MDLRQQLGRNMDTMGQKLGRNMDNVRQQLGSNKDNLRQQYQMNSEVLQDNITGTISEYIAILLAHQISFL